MAKLYGRFIHAPTALDRFLQWHCKWEWPCRIGMAILSTFGIAGLFWVTMGHALPPMKFLWWCLGCCQRLILGIF